MAALRVALLTSLLGGLLGCGPERPPNVLLIVVDTLRADHLSCYGSARTTSPAIDALAAEGVRFSRAYATGPWTKPSVASILTGLYPSAHAVTRLPRRLPEHIPTLAERLRSRGYATAGVVSHMLIGSRYGFGRGFEVYLESESRGAEHVSSDGVTAQATRLLEELAAGDRPFFLFVHYFDPHYTYQRHPRYGFAAARGAGRLRGGEPVRALRRIAPSMTPAEIQLVRDLYDEEIRFTDDAIGRLLARLRELGLAERTWTVLTADHGEEFLERGQLGHTRTLHEELVRVPLILRGPGAPRGRTLDRPVSLVSLTASILEMSGSPARGALHGASLLPLLAPGADPSLPPPFFEVDFVPLRPENAHNEAHQRGLVTAEFKLIEDLKTGAVSLYDLRSDPGERVALAGERPALLRRLRARLNATAVGMSRSGRGVRDMPLTEQQIERLRELGYVAD